MEKISFCTVCMNRLHQLKETLPVNIRRYADKANIEFVLLNYNSQDELDEWVKSDLSEYIESGLLVYYRSPDHEVFSHSHSKNMIFRLATGHILCSINADHFIGPAFDEYLLTVFKKFPRSFVSPYIPHGSKQKYIPPKDVVGKVCLRRSDFYALSGFDERFKNYGFEDVDLVKRLENFGLKRIVLNNEEFLRFIEHGDDERLRKKEPEFFEAYIRYVSPWETDVIYLNNDKSFEMVTYVKISIIYAHKYTYAFKPRKNLYDFSIKRGHWKKGLWSQNGDIIKFKEIDWSLKQSYSSDKIFLTDINTNKVFAKVLKKENLINLNSMLSFMNNLAYMKKNILQKRVAVNKSNFGSGRVFKNFNNEAIKVN